MYMSIVLLHLTHLIKNHGRNKDEWSLQTSTYIWYVLMCFCDYTHGKNVWKGTHFNETFIFSEW